MEVERYIIAGECIEMIYRADLYTQKVIHVGNAEQITDRYRPARVLVLLCVQDIVVVKLADK